jgi:hypothetical protein
LLIQRFNKNTMMKFCFISKAGSTAADDEDDERIKGRETERIHPLNLLLYYYYFFLLP